MRQCPTSLLPVQELPEQQHSVQNVVQQHSVQNVQMGTAGHGSSHSWHLWLLLKDCREPCKAPVLLAEGES